MTLACKLLSWQLCESFDILPIEIEMAKPTNYSSRECSGISYIGMTRIPYRNNTLP